MNLKSKTAAYLIAFHFCWDIKDVQDNRYQANRHDAAIYTLGNDYYCAPAIGKPLPAGERWHWEKVAEYEGRAIWCSKVNAA